MTDSNEKVTEPTAYGAAELAGVVQSVGTRCRQLQSLDLKCLRESREHTSDPRIHTAFAASLLQR